MWEGPRNNYQGPVFFVELPDAGPVQFPFFQTRNENQAPAATTGVQGTGARPLKEDKASFETLTNTITSLVGAVKNMSLQLDEISSTVKDFVKTHKTRGKSAGPVILVDPKRDVIGEFHNLKQTTTVAEYQEKFEELRDLMVKMNCGLSEGYLISSFLSGLKREVKESFANSKPDTLSHAFNHARVQETAIEEMKDKVLKDKLRSSGRDDPNLQCTQVQVFISPDHPLKFGALVGEKEMTVLISTGIEHSYIDTSLAIAAGCNIEEAEPLRVHFLMLGYKALSRFRCPNFEWTMQGHKFSAGLRIVEIKAAYDIVLGADWVHKNNPLSFTADGIFLEKEGKEIVLLDKSGSAQSQRSKRMCFTSEGVFIQDGESLMPLHTGAESYKL